MKLKAYLAVVVVLSLFGCSTGGQFDQMRAKVLNNFQDADLKISPDITRQAKIENAHIFSPGQVLMVGLDITMPKSCSLLMIYGSFLDKDGKKVAALSGTIQGYENNQTAHMNTNSANTAPLLLFDSTIATISLDTLKCM